VFAPRPGTIEALAHGLAEGRPVPLPDAGREVECRRAGANDERRVVMTDAIAAVGPFAKHLHFLR
jgi:hypothetical protein